MMKFMITKVLGKQSLLYSSFTVSVKFSVTTIRKDHLQIFIKKKKKTLHLCCIILTSSAFPELLSETLLWPNNSQNTADQCVTEVIL